MKNNKSVDGIILRRQNEATGDLVKPNVTHANNKLDDALSHKTTEKSREITTDISQNPTVVTKSSAKKARTEKREMDNDLAETLADMDINELDKTPEEIPESPKMKMSREERKRLKKEKKQKHKKRRRIIKLCIILIVLALVGTVSWICLKSMDNICKVFKCDPNNPLGSMVDVITAKTEPLKQDENGRTNILVLGTADDDAGHEGGTLTDSIMIISLDQAKKNAFMISIPRDLWVKYGQACPAGYQGKINAAYSCFGGASGDIEKDRAALDRASTFYGDIFGLDIQYAANVNYTVFRDTVNAVGGKITVDIESRDKRGILDSSFDGMCGKTSAEKQQRCPTGHFLQLTNGTHEIDADMALALALARGHEGSKTYGLSMGNFDREKNQQLVMKAILKQATSAGILTNPSAITSLLDSLGNNLRTTFGSNEIRTLMKLAQDGIDPDSILSLSLVDENLLTTGMVNSQSVVIPTSGTFNYAKIQAFLDENLTSDPLAREKATISVYNGSGEAGAAAKTTEKLTSANLNATTIGNTSNIDGSYAVYDLTDGKKSETAKILADELGVEIKKASASELPADIKTSANFVVIVGKK